MSTAFTVLLPVHRPPALLPHAIESVLAQTLADFELLVICDGAPEETAACARVYAGADARVKVLQFPKGERFGEAHRHIVLEKASGRCVAHIADDDLWMPDHLREMSELLREVDFGNVLHLHVYPGGRLSLVACDLARPALRERMLQQQHNRFGLARDFGQVSVFVRHRPRRAQLNAIDQLVLRQPALVDRRSLRGQLSAANDVWCCYRR